ncbi:MAG TPA: sugar phosphate isomerase/epimerase family protein [bacterium]|nr:sugar phosphate isomerase/epimerase family protein [bacterium]HPP08876.1 sugar phosphate isomerase/epimerase family protein [bacterium]
MKYAISNIAWQKEMTDQVFSLLQEYSISGIEIAPSRVWEHTDKISYTQVVKYRRKVAKWGLEIVGFHSLFYDHPGLGLFKEKDVEKKTKDFLKHLITVCADCGGKTLIFGSPKARKRGDLPLDRAIEIAADFFIEVAEKAKEKKVFLCIEPLGPDETDFIDSACSALQLIKKVNHPYFQGHLDAKSLYASREISYQTFQNFAPFLKHFHVNEPELKPISISKQIDHCLIGKYLRKIGYSGYVSIEQRSVDTMDTLGVIKKSIMEMKKCYAN